MHHPSLSPSLINVLHFKPNFKLQTTSVLEAGRPMRHKGKTLRILQYFSGAANTFPRCVLANAMSIYAVYSISKAVAESRWI